MISTLKNPFTAEELTKIEAEMKKIVKEGIPLESYEMSPEDAIKTLEEQGRDLQSRALSGACGKKANLFHFTSREILRPVRRSAPL